MRLQPAAQAKEHLLCLLTRRLTHHDRPEAAFERGVLFDILPVFCQRRRADHLKLAPTQRRLEQIRCVDRALRASGADQRVHLVHKKDNIPAAADLSQNVADTLLKFAAVFRSRQHARHIQAEQALCPQRLRDVPGSDPLRESLHNGRFPDARFADQRRIVLVFPAQDLQDGRYLLLAPNHRVAARRLFQHIFTV
ncbi:putative uncharacterized protein [Firmicutes bacterium CAG:170]|nr:putative uncharacterized protein [Firmicutes bacterium CAG:170]